MSSAAVGILTDKHMLCL